jgi:hypothetical protein
MCSHLIDYRSGRTKLQTMTSTTGVELLGGSIHQAPLRCLLD